MRNLYKAKIIFYNQSIKMNGINICNGIRFKAWSEKNPQVVTSIEFYIENLIPNFEDKEPQLVYLYVLSPDFIIELLKSQEKAYWGNLSDSKFGEILSLCKV